MPDKAKFNRPDPQRDWDWLRPHTLNLYEYCSNDPVNNWDPTGFTDQVEREDETSDFSMNYTKASLSDYIGAVKKRIGDVGDVLTAPGNWLVGAFDSVTKGFEETVDFLGESVSAANHAAGQFNRELASLGKELFFNPSGVLNDLHDQLQTPQGQVDVVAGLFTSKIHPAVTKRLSKSKIRPIPKISPIPKIDLSTGFGHTFKNHGENATNFITQRAKGSGLPSGQFLDDQVAARFILGKIPSLKNGAQSFPMPKGFPA